jgi:hypothetical protein
VPLLLVVHGWRLGWRFFVIVASGKLLSVYVVVPVIFDILEKKYTEIKLLQYYFYSIVLVVVLV